MCPPQVLLGASVAMLPVLAVSDASPGPVQGIQMSLLRAVVLHRLVHFVLFWLSSVPGDAIGYKIWCKISCILRAFLCLDHS